MHGHVILSHGSDSGPDATKVSALAVVAERRGWRTTRADYRDCDALGHAACVAPRVERLRGLVRPGERTVLMGSSMGSFASGLASLATDAPGTDVHALFLLALPLEIPGFAQPFDAARVATTIVHGWDDDICPAKPVLDFARDRRASLVMLPDGHRLIDHLALIAGHFDAFLAAIETVPAQAGAAS